MKLALPDTEKLYHVIADEAVMGFLTFDRADDACVYANRLGRSLMEISESADISSLHLSQLFPQNSFDHSRPLQKETVNCEGFFQDVLVQKSNGQFLIGNVGIKHLELNGRPHILLMIQDITLQKKLQREVVAKQTEIKVAYEELLRQNRQLKELDLAKNRFVALTTHELRTPASAMLGSAEILKMGLFDTKEEMNEFISIIYDQGQHLLELINDVLDFSKIQSGKMDFFVSEHNVIPLLQNQIDQHQGLAEQSKITLKLTSTVQNVKCYFDELRLKQIVSNMLSNAIKYNKPNGWANIQITDDELVVRITVEDSGKGIPSDQLTKVFDEFETLGKVALHHKGTGLGMPISKKLIEGMGGSIGLSSIEGQGSKFWVEIPKHKVLPESVYRLRPGASGNLAA